MTKADFKLGQTVFVMKVGNAARHRHPDDLVTEEVVEKLGNKYFYLEGYSNDKFSYETCLNVSEYTASSAVYLSRKEIDDEREHHSKLRKIQRFFSHYGSISITLEEIRIISDMLGDRLK